MKIVINIDPECYFYIPYNIMKKYCKIKKIKFKPYIYTWICQFNKLNQTEANKEKDSVLYYDRTITNKNYHKAIKIMVDRNDPDLIKILENEPCANLKIVEIPDGIDWHVIPTKLSRKTEQIIEVVKPRTWK